MNAQEEQRNASNFGLPGIIDLPTAKHFSDGELIFTHQNHEYLFMSGISFQALPRLGVSFNMGGKAEEERLHRIINWDRSFDAHISLTKEGKYLPAISIGLRDFIGTGWYSSEYLVGTKSFGELELTAGLGFGRLAGRNTFSNPLSYLSPRFDRAKIKITTAKAVRWELLIGFMVMLQAFLAFVIKLAKRSHFQQNILQTR